MSYDVYMYTLPCALFAQRGEDRRIPFVQPSFTKQPQPGAHMVHTYFEADEDDGIKHAAPAAQSPASASAQCARCCARVRVDYTEQDPCYVFEAVCSPDNSMVAASTSQNTVKLYSCAPTQLAHQADVAAHSGTITQIRFPLQQHPNALYSCSRDGSIRAWDIRTRQLAESYQSGGQELFCCCIMDQLVVGGGQGDVLFWDRRTQRALERFDDMHMDDVTQVVYHAASRKLLTASEDGLVAVHDVAQGLNQDDGFEAALNVGTSVVEIGLYGPHQERLWARTGTEGLQLWEWGAAAAAEVEGGDTAFLDLAEARQAAATAAAGAAGSGVSPAAAALHEVDYLVTCHWDAVSDQLLLVAGNNQGAAAFFPLREAAARQQQLAAGSNPVCAPAVVLQGCHDSVVRSVQCFAGEAASRLLCLSAGEDARVGLWSMTPDPGASPATSGSLGSAGGPARQHASSKAQRRSPY